MCTAEIRRAYNYIMKNQAQYIVINVILILYGYVFFQTQLNFVHQPRFNFHPQFI